MSSILDALKKADREAAAERSENTPWAKDAPLPPPDRNNGWHWWAGAGIAVCMAVAGFFFLSPETGETPPHKPPEENAPAPMRNQKPGSQIEPSPPAQVLSTVENSQQKRTIPQGQEAGTPQESDEEPLDSLTRQPEGQPDQRQRQPESAKESTLGPTKAQSGTVEMPFQPRPSETKTGIDDASNKTLEPQRDKTEQQQEKPMAAEEKNFKRDPRIDLQALVWAENPEDRFAVINNQLIREGGAIDTIVVEKINPDDVRLTEGDETWYEAFQIR